MARTADDPSFSLFSLSNQEEMEQWCLILKCSTRELREAASQGACTLGAIERQLSYKWMLTRI
jgi:hypothetical protein